MQVRSLERGILPGSIAIFEWELQHLEIIKHLTQGAHLSQATLWELVDQEGNRLDTETLILVVNNSNPSTWKAEKGDL